MIAPNIPHLSSYDEADEMIGKLEDGGLRAYVVFNSREPSFIGENDYIVFEPRAENITADIIELGLQFVKRYKSDQDFCESVVQYFVNTGEILKPNHH